MPSTPESTLQRVLPTQQAWALYGAAASRRIEAAAQAGLAPHTLMQRAGLALARLANAVAPHARRVHIVCGPGNNGGDGLEAAPHLQAAGREVRVSLLADPGRLPADAAASLARAQAASVPIEATLPERFDADLLIDALLGLGASRPPQGAIAEAIARLRAETAPVLAVDLPSGLHPDTGALLGKCAVRAAHTLALLTLKPGLFTAHGRDHAGQVWYHALGVSPPDEAPLGRLAGPPAADAPRRHAQHKGSFGDVLVIGGAPGMAGAALLAGRAALAAGAGRVYLALLDPAAPALDAGHPELMHRPEAAHDARFIAACSVVCGCGGGSAVRATLSAVLIRAPRLVFDADALNAVAADTGLQAQLAARTARAQPTLLTPHPLEAARLLGCTAAQVQADRLTSAQQLSDRFGCAVLLKGSGSISAAPGTLPFVNPTGNALLATAGTGDVLAGWAGGRWSQAPETTAQAIAVDAAFLHGRAADRAAARGLAGPLRASALIEAMQGAQGSSSGR